MCKEIRLQKLSYRPLAPGCDLCLILSYYLLKSPHSSRNKSSFLLIDLILQFPQSLVIMHEEFRKAGLIGLRNTALASTYYLLKLY